VKLISTAFLLLAAFVAASRPALLADEARQAPELPFVLPQGVHKSLSEYRGRVVALEFILTTCVHCQAASKVMTGLQADYGNRGFQALDLAINGLDEGRTPKDADVLVENFSRYFQVGFPVGWVERDRMLAFMGFSVMQRVMVPQLALIDRKGVIRYQTPAGGEEHAMQEATIRERIEQLLTEGAPAPSARTREPRTKSKP